jgi:hypothetical protein
VKDPDLDRICRNADLRTEARGGDRACSDQLPTDLDESTPTHSAHKLILLAKGRTSFAKSGDRDSLRLNRGGAVQARGRGAGARRRGGDDGAKASEFAAHRSAAPGRDPR